MLTDIEIAQRADMLNICEIAKKAGISEDDLECYGKYKAKISSEAIKKAEQNEDGKLILVTAINPTPAGEGKTTVAIGLGDALTSMGKKTFIALREPLPSASISVSSSPFINVMIIFTTSFSRENSKSVTLIAEGVLR